MRTDAELTAFTRGIIPLLRHFDRQPDVVFLGLAMFVPTLSDCREINGDLMRGCKFHSKQVIDRNQALRSPVSVTRRRSDNIRKRHSSNEIRFQSAAIDRDCANESERAAEIGVQN